MFKKYHTLDRDGFSHIGSQLNDGDVYLNKHVPNLEEIPREATL